MSSREVPDGHYTVPLGKAKVVREGEALTVLAYGTMVHVALAAVEENGVDAEVIDLRTLVPLDIETIEESVKKTGRCLVVQEATRTSGFGAELATPGAGALLLSSRSAGRARHRLGHALSARLRMGLFPGPDPHEERPQEGARSMMRLSVQAARHRRRHRRGRDRRLARQGRRQGRGRPAARRHDDRQGDGRNGIARCGRGQEAGRRSRRPDRDRIGAGGDRDRRRRARGEASQRPKARANSRWPMARKYRRPSRKKAMPVMATAPEPAAPQAGASKSRMSQPSPPQQDSRPRMVRRSSPLPPCANAPATSASTWPGEDHERPCSPRRPRRLPALQWRQRVGSWRGSARRRNDQGRRPPPQDRREYAGGEAPHPALRAGRGVRRHRARGNAGDDEPRPRRQPQADAAALPDHCDGQGGRGLADAQRDLRRRGQCRHSPRRGPHGRRDADRRRADGPGHPQRPSDERVAAGRAKCCASATPRAAARPAARS